MLKQVSIFAVLAMALLDRMQRYGSEGRRSKSRAGRQVRTGEARLKAKYGRIDHPVLRIPGNRDSLWDAGWSAVSPRQSGSTQSAADLDTRYAERGERQGRYQAAAKKKKAVKKRAVTRGAQAKKKRAPAKSSTSRKKSTTTTGTTPSKPVRKRKTNPSNRKAKPVQARAKTAAKKVKARSKSTRTRTR